MRGKKKKELTNNERAEVVAMLLGISMVGRLPDGIFVKVAKKFDISARTIRRVWQRAKITRKQGKTLTDEVESKNKERGYARKRWDSEELFEAIKAIPFRERPTWDALAQRIGVPESTLRRLKGQGLFRHTSPLKPFLTDEHMIARIDHCISKINPSRPANTPRRYRNMYDEVHVDEKWFYLTEDGQTFILAEGEPLPQRKVRHKGYILKIMFLCAQARPRMVNGIMWDGKIGIWPIGRVVPAQRSSVNRPAGTPTWENDTIDRDKYRQLMISEVLPAIIAKFPWTYLTRNGKSVKIQQDGAKSHIEDDDEEWLQAVEELGVNVKLYTQAAQSPDLNINDLAFFRSIMSLKKRAAPRTAFELIDAVKAAYEEYPPEKINRMWLTLQAVMNEIIEADGNNDFKLPHMNKKKLEREDRLPVVLEVTESVANYL